MKKTISQLAETVPCIRFVFDNYGLLNCVHRDKTVLVVGEFVAKVLPSIFEAFRYTDSMEMRDTPYAIYECNGRKPEESIIISKACRRS